MDDFYTCKRDGPCTRIATAQPQQGSESISIVQRLDDLMRRCREEGHRLVYQDLLQVRHGAPGPQHQGEVRHVGV